MNFQPTFQHLSRLLVLLSISIFVGTVIELLAAKHYGGTLQLIPFGLTSICFISTIAGWIRPTPILIRANQGILLITGIGSLVGMYFHIRGNIGFVTDFHPDASWQYIARESFTGRDPILAPGILLLGAIIGLTAVQTRRQAMCADRNPHEIGSSSVGTAST